MSIGQEHYASAPVGRFAPASVAVRAPAERQQKTGLAVYRDNVIVALVNALAARYPVVRRMAGDESFRAAAHRFVMAELPRSLALLHYGETFPRFLRSLGHGASYEYLADIAELELAREKAYRTAAACSLGAQALSVLSTDRLDALRVTLHPSVSLVPSRFPIVTIWQANRSDGDGMIERWGAEAALIARPFAAVVVHRLPHGGHAFMAALLEGKTLAQAAKAGTAAAPAFDQTANLAMLVASKIVVDLVRGA
jgi:putative DNA-binding protein